MTMGRNDAIRSLLAQRAYVGDSVMRELWYPVALLDAQEMQQTSVRDELNRLRKHFSRPVNPLPSPRWIAERSSHKDLYDYLHAATSRALHFSMGEVMRNGWGEPGRKAGHPETGVPRLPNQLRTRPTTETIPADCNCLQRPSRGCWNHRTRRPGYTDAAVQGGGRLYRIRRRTTRPCPRMESDPGRTARHP